MSGTIPTVTVYTSEGTSDGTSDEEVPLGNDFRKPRRAKLQRESKDIKEMLKSIHNTKNTSLTFNLLPLSGAHDFAGCCIRAECNPQCPMPPVQQMISNWLPPWVVPMFAPFDEPYVSDWLQSMQRAIEFVLSRDHLNYTDNEQHMILVPINSPGGNIDLLKRMIHMVNAVKSHLIGKDSKNPKRRIKFVTYGTGTVASCAFVLYQLGDVCLSAEDAGYLCHEPMLMGGNPVTSAESAERNACSLKATQDRIYQKAEACMLERYNKDYARNHDTIQERAEWRERWRSHHKKPLLGFMKECRGLSSGNTLPAFDQPERKTVYHFITEELANDRHDKFLSPKWMKELGLLDEKDLDIQCEQQDTMRITFNTTIETMI